MLRAVVVVLLFGCGGPAFAPVTIGFNDPGLSFSTMLVTAENRINPSCTANCEMGPAFPDGGAGILVPSGYRQVDAGFAFWGPDQVLVGAMVSLAVTLVNPAPGTQCVARREVQSQGLEAIATIEYNGGAQTCSFTFR